MILYKVFMLISLPFWANAYAYDWDNRIVSFSPSAPYTEVCFKDGATFFDVHGAEESTEGGSCLPGDRGFVIERDQRAKRNWTMARQICMEQGMRLPHVFEWQLSCDNAKDWSIIKMVRHGWEWASDTAWPEELNKTAGLAAAVFGSNGCDYGTWRWVAFYNGTRSVQPFRCAR